MAAPSLIRRFFGVYVLVGLVVLTASVFALIRLPILFRSSVVPDVWIVDGKGAVLSASSDTPLPVPWEKLSPPERTAQGKLLENSTINVRHWLFRLSDSPPRFLLYRPRMSFSGRVFVLAFLALPILLALAAVFVALIYLYARAKGAQARQVVSRLKSGDLKARFQVTKLDEVGRSMQAFNEMADEIERLVEKVREVEARRTRMLRELAHDVRTPLTSLAYLFETITDPAGKLAPEELREKAALATADLHYLHRLVEDLFLLAESEDHRRSLPREKVDPLELVEAELERLRRLVPGKGAIRFQLDAEVPEGVYLEANPYLMRRLVGNALENASQFARERVEVIMQPAEDGRLEIQVRDDGPGFTPDALEGFGKRRQARFIDTRDKTKASLGLGSVIIKTVAELHGGEVKAGNWFTDTGAVGGACIRIRLPLGGAAIKAA